MLYNGCSDNCLPKQIPPSLPPDQNPPPPSTSPLTDDQRESTPSTFCAQSLGVLVDLDNENLNKSYQLIYYGLKGDAISPYEKFTSLKIGMKMHYEKDLINV